MTALSSHAAAPAVAGRATIRVGIIGAAGYVGGELIRLLERHPDVHLAGLQGRDREHEPVTLSHPQLAGSRQRHIAKRSELHIRHPSATSNIFFLLNQNCRAEGYGYPPFYPGSDQS
jgi:N-acetyl-gamma-glutamylphosphate reductase